MNMQIVSDVVIDEAKLPESVHEEADPRPGSPHHLRQRLLTQPGDRHFGHSLFSELRHQQKDPGKPLFTGVEQLIDQIILISDVSSQQVLQKYGRQLWLQPHCLHHRLPLDVQQDTLSRRDRRRHAQQLTSETTFPKEIAFAQNANGRFFASFRYHAEPYLASLDKEQSVGGVPLGKNHILFLKSEHFPARPDR